MNLRELPITKLFVESGRFEDLCHEHHVAGLFYFQEPDERLELKGEWFNQWKFNETLLKAWQEFKDLPLVPLKGVSLLGSIYPDYGSRFMRDMDFLVDRNQYEEVKKSLLKLQYKPVGETHWYGNNFKEVFSKIIDGQEVVVEIHCALFHHRKKLAPVMDGEKLETNFEFLYLVGHAIFQHNSQKLYWIFDLFFYINHHSLDYEKVYLLAKKYRLINSSRVAFYLLEKFFGLERDKQREFFFEHQKNYLWKQVINKEYLLTTSVGGWRYFIIKLLLRDKFFDAFKYFFLGLIYRVKR